MSALREAATSIARRPPVAVLTSERLFATERAAAELEGRRIGPPRAAPPDPAEVEAIAPTELRRLLGTLWTDQRWDRAAARLVARGRETGARSLDRAMILTYLRHFPVRHRAFGDLRAAAAAASVAHDWPWATRGERWALWTPDGPPRVRDAIAAVTLDDPGLMRVLSGSAFLAAPPGGHP